MRSSTAWPCAFVILAAGCNGGQSGEPNEKPFTEARSSLARELNPDVSDDQLASLADGNRAFALDMYSQLVSEQPDEGLFFSPYSISIALAMTYAGAAGSTADAMESTLHFQLEEPALHAAFDSVDLALGSRGEGAKGQDDQPFRLHVTNSIWGQQGVPFLDPFLDTLAVHYGAGLRLLDFSADAEAGREAINAWVEEQTEERIVDLLPEGSIDASTLIVLVNAIYFNAAWENKFEKTATIPGDFTTLGGSVVSVPMMKSTEPLGYYAGAGVQAVEKPYDGGELSMVLIVPDSGQLASFEASLTSASLREILSGLQSQHGTLSMPKWSYDGESISLQSVLTALGMGVAFGDGADFSRLTKGEEILISGVYHQAFVAVDENGTEAAAATGVVGSRTSAPIPQFDLRIDRPFIYLIRDIATDTIVFMGRVADPS
ncbi:MAG TPA: serpin family protein [Polyangiales bacterium]|nr:serpin family protein [Polyangiales bacterium]